MFGRTILSEASKTQVWQADREQVELVTQASETSVSKAWVFVLNKKWLASSNSAHAYKKAPASAWAFFIACAGK